MGFSWHGKMICGISAFLTAVLLISGAVYASGFSTKVVGLYDSSEGSSAGAFPGEAVKALEEIGFEITYHDVSGGLPGAETMSGSRGIITSFSDSSMNGAAEYCKWVEEQVEKGLVFVALRNFGAYQDSASGRWLEYADVNKAFGAIGLNYLAEWTGNPDLIKIIGIEGEEIKNPGSLKIDNYYYFKQTGVSARGVVVAGRTDREGQESFIVSSSPQGGIVAEEIAGFDYGRYFEGIFFGDALRDRFLLVYDEELAGSGQIIGNVKRIQRYTRIKGDLLRLQGDEKLIQGDIGKYGAVMLALSENFKGGSDLAKSLKSYVEKGGGIISLNPVTSHALYPLFSLNGNHQKKLKKGFGMDFAGIFYPEANKFNVAKDGYQFSGIDIKQPPGSELLISAHKSGEKEALVMAFMVRKGKGRAVFLNNLDAGSRYFTGMLAQLLIHALDTAAVPLFAIRTLFVDDCPLPMWNREVEGEEKTDTEFYLKDFFEEIVSLSDRFKIKPSFFAVFSYDDRVEPPFDFTQFQIGKDNASLELAGKIMDHGFELGLHGYNHLSLALSGGVSKPWKSGESMEKALLSVRKYWTERFGGGNLPVVYVAPNNYIDAAGKKAIKNAIPEIRVISALMNGDENETSQDIGFDSEEPHFFNLPRTSAGYMLGGEQKLSLINGIMLAGFWTHFIHPDDAYDPARSQKFKWKDLIASFRKVFEDVEKSYPFLRAMTARDAFYEAMKISDTGFNFKSSAKKIGYEITPGTESPFFMLLKIPAGSKIKKTEGFEKISYNMKSGYMFVKTIGHRGSVLYD